MTERILASPESLIKYLKLDNEIRLTREHEARIKRLHLENRAALERALARFDSAGLRRPLAPHAALRRAGNFLKDVDEALSRGNAAHLSPSPPSSPSPSSFFSPSPLLPGSKSMATRRGSITSTPEPAETPSIPSNAPSICDLSPSQTPDDQHHTHESPPIASSEFGDLSLDSKLLEVDLDMASGGLEEEKEDKRGTRRQRSPEATGPIAFKNFSSPEKRARVKCDGVKPQSPARDARQTEAGKVNERLAKPKREIKATVPHNVNVVGSRKEMELLHGLMHNHAYEPICFGAHYHLTMLVSRNIVCWDTIHLPSLNALRGLSNREAAARLQEPPFNLMPLDASAFEDLDKEEEALQRHGICVDTEKGWCGGRVFFTGTLGPDPGCPDDFTVKLDPPRCAHSTRFSRRFGSARFLRIRLHHTAMTTPNRNSLKVFLTKDFFLAGRRYRPLLQRDDTFFLFNIDDDMPSIASFLDWHGPFAQNGSTKLLKYLQRLVLGFSSSIAGPTLPPESVSFDRDIVAPTGQIMTDGAAAISEEALRAVTGAAGWERPPAAFQARFAGAKGMWYVEPQSAPGMHLSIRDSQLKLKRPKPCSEDPALNTIDVLSPAQVSWPSTLSKQIVLVLAHNGVSYETLIELQSQSLRQVTDQLSFDRTCTELVRAVDKFGNVSNNRNNRNQLDARARGLKSRLEDQRDRDGKEEEDGELFTTPKSKLEKCYEMLLAGFHPRQSAYLADQMVDATRDILQRALNKFQIKVPRSVEVIVIPDPVGVLEEGEVQLIFNSSKMPRDPDSGIDIPALEGDVLVTRHPCLTPADCRRVRATTYKALERYSGLIIFSTKGDRSLADVLSGGDMDGDTIRVIWEPTIVEGFKNIDLERCKPSISLDDAFHRDERTLDSFLQTCGDGEDRDVALVQIVTQNVFAMDLVGVYGNLTLCSAYKNGLQHQDTIDMAFKFNQTMDGVKNGVYIKDEVLRADQMRYNEKLPNWESQSADSIPNVIKRHQSLPPCILDVLWLVGSEEASQIVRKRGLEVLNADDDDPNLAFLWSESIAKGRLSSTQQLAIKSHIDKFFETYTSLWTNHYKTTPGRATSRTSTPLGNTSNTSPAKTSPAKRQTASKPPLDSHDDHGDTLASREVATTVLHLYHSWQTSKIGLDICGLDPPKSARVSPFLTPPTSSQGSEPGSVATSSLPGGGEASNYNSYHLEARLTTPELRFFKQLVASCLYATAVEQTKGDKSRRIKRIKLAFDVAWRDLIDCKVAKRPSVTMTYATYQSLRLMRQAADV